MTMASPFGSEALQHAPCPDFGLTEKQALVVALLWERKGKIIACSELAALTGRSIAAMHVGKYAINAHLRRHGWRIASNQGTGGGYFLERIAP